jgi:bacterioferritin-associated ferredoxin
MYVCLCHGVTSQTVSAAVARGASTSKEVAAACGAGSECGRCRRTVRAIIAADLGSTPSSSDNESIKHLTLDITPVRRG